MRVAIDVSHLNHDQLSGIGIYTVELIKALSALPDLELTAVYRPGRFRHRRYFKKHVGGAQPWWLGGLGVNVDVLHGPDFRVSNARNAKRVVTILDLAFLKEGMTSPEFAQKKKQDLDNLLDQNTPDALIAISEATKKELTEYRPKLTDRVHTVLLGGDHVQVTEDGIRPHNRPYFLFVGNIEARKNVLGVVKAFEQFAGNTPGYDIILIGKSGFNAELVLRAIEASDYKKNVKVLGYCSREDLQSYYRQAVALVYPSWIEGFGIPVLEAMRLGCPVITSNTTSTFEIVGNTGWGVNPADTSAIAAAMFEAARLRTQPEKFKDFIRRAQNQAAQFTWKRCAEETLKVYNTIIK